MERRRGRKGIEGGKEEGLEVEKEGEIGEGIGEG
jgi:hypothetical protein